MKILLTILFITFLFIQTSFSSTPKERNLLSGNLTVEQLDKIITQGKEWIEFPSYKQRDKWNQIPEDIRLDYIQRAEKIIDYDWPTLKATQYLEYERSGNRKMFEVPYNERKNNLELLVLAELFEGKGRFIDAVIDGVWSFCEQTYWGLSAHVWLQKTGKGLPNVQEPTIDLGAGNVAYLLAWIDYFLKDEFDKVNPFISERIHFEIKQKILEPYYNREDFWWMGFNTDLSNNWTPWVNYNVLNCILLVETDREKMINNINKVMRSVDKFINYYKDDGGCDEGPSYWQHAGGKMLDNLELLYEVSKGKIDIFDNELIKNMGRYIYRVYISNSYYINFADALNKVNMPPDLIYRYGKRINDPLLKGFGAYLAQKDEYQKKIKNSTGPIGHVLHNLLNLNEIMNDKPVEPLIDKFWLPDIQVVGARENEGSSSGFYFAAKGGHNEESHNHNDAGNFILYYNGHPFFVDAGVGTYTRKTFSSERYELWNMQSQYHNLPTINGVMQKNGKEFAAGNVSFSSSENNIMFALDIGSAYPAEANVNKWRRIYNFKKSEGLEISDEYEFTKNSGKTCLNFLTNRSVVVSSPGIIKVGNEEDQLFLKYDEQQLKASFEKVNIDDERLNNGWPDGLNRIILVLQTDNLSGKINLKISDE